MNSDPTTRRRNQDMAVADAARLGSEVLVSAAYHLHGVARRTSRVLHRAADRLVSAAFWLDDRHDQLEERYR